jgi:thiamine pyrophosphate-dependent acetolactate synthase large subunit-like protein
VRHEEVVAFAASAQAKITGKLGVCAGTVGPVVVDVQTNTDELVMPPAVSASTVMNFAKSWVKDLWSEKE